MEHCALIEFLHFVVMLSHNDKILNYQTILVSILVCELLASNKYMFKGNNINTRKWCEVCSKLTIKTFEQRDMFKVNNNDTRTTSMASF